MVQGITFPPTSGGIANEGPIATSIAQLQSYVNNPSIHLVWIDPTLDGDTSTLTIARSNLSIVSLLSCVQESGGSWWVVPRIKTVIIDATSQDIQNVSLSGFNLRQLDHYANGHAIIGTQIDKCGFRPDGTTGGKGIRFLGDHIIYYNRFNDCFILDNYDQTADGLGAISFQQTVNVGSGQHYWKNLIYKCMPTTRDNQVLVAWETACRTDQDCVFDLLNYVQTASSGCHVARFKNASKQGTLKFINGTYEIHETEVMFLNDAGATGATQKRQFFFNGNMGSLADNGQTVTIFDNNSVVTDYYAAAQSWLFGRNNRFFTETGTITIGDVAANARYLVDLGYTLYTGLVETENNVAAKG